MKYLEGKMKTEEIKSRYPQLKEVLVEREDGITFRGRHVLPTIPVAKKPIPQLKYYTTDASAVIEHNIRWADGQEEAPKFKFAYISLPTGCNLRCMGCFEAKDKKRANPKLEGEFYSPETLSGVTGFLREHGAESVIYAGGGELFSWKGAFDYIDRIRCAGLAMMIFTNGTLLKKEQMQRLARDKISLTLSLRGTSEREHNTSVRRDTFRKTLDAIEWALEEGMHLDQRLAVEIPVRKDQEEKVLLEFIPALRHLGVIPFVEEYIQTQTSDEEKGQCHNFREARDFFRRAAEVDGKFGFVNDLRNGHRMLGQPPCQRPLYSFAVFPSGDVHSCITATTKYGNIYDTPLEGIFHSNIFKRAVKNQTYCPCSVFYTESEADVPEKLPVHLEVLR